MDRMSLFARFAASTLLLGLLIGCGASGPETSTVEGTVTLDGQPLAGALLIFTPQGTAGGRMSGGQTDAQGHYELTYSRDQMGAVPGEHKIEITTYGQGEGDEPTPEKLPAKYNTQSELIKTVEPGENTIDFELSSEGEIVLPYQGEQ